MGSQTFHFPKGEILLFPRVKLRKLLQVTDEDGDRAPNLHPSFLTIYLMHSLDSRVLILVCVVCCAIILSFSFSSLPPSLLPFLPSFASDLHKFNMDRKKLVLSHLTLVTPHKVSQNVSLSFTKTKTWNLCYLSKVTVKFIIAELGYKPSSCSLTCPLWEKWG